jgi:predicted RND superfamily exporter protein
LSPSFLRRWGLVVVVAALLVTAGFGFFAAQVGPEHDNASLRSIDAESSRVAAGFREAFGSEEDILVALGHPRLLEAEGLRLVADLSTRIAAMDGVRQVWSLANAEELVAGPAGPEPRSLLSPPWEEPGLAARASAALDRNPDLTGYLVSADRRSAGFVVEVEDRPTDTEYRSVLVAALRALAPEVSARGGELHLTGVPVQKIDVSASVDRDRRLLMPAAMAVLGLVLAVFYRHPAGVLVPLAAAGATVACTLGAYAIGGYALNAITALLPPVLLVVALASTVHVVDAWMAGHAPKPVAQASAVTSPASLPDSRTSSAKSPATDREIGADEGFARASGAARAVFLPALMCAVTTAQGFVSLAVGGDLPAVSRFGLFAALGTGVAFVLSMSVVPALLGRFSPPRRRDDAGRDRTAGFLDATAHLATSRPWAVVTAFAALTVALAAGIPKVRSDTDLVGFLRESAPLRVDTAWIDRNLGGSLPFEFLIRRRDGFGLDGEKALVHLQALQSLEDFARGLDHVAGVASVAALARQAARASGRGGLALPTDPEAATEILDLLDESGHAMVRRYAAPEGKALRLTVRLRAVGSGQSAPVVVAIRDEGRRLFGPDIDVQATGPLWEVVRDSENLVRRQVTSFATAIVLVVASIGLLMRSWSFTLVAMIPNVMPIVWTGGVMGWTGIELSTGTAMIASAVLGLVVDDTIHYLHHYRRVGGDAVEAVLATTRAVGAPVTVSSVALVLGFWVGALGSFRPTVYFSLLTGLTMIAGVLCDLLVLPASLVLLDRATRRRLPRVRGRIDSAPT